MFELSHLRCFDALADELHFGRAATRLNMSQPPLSRQIQLLEAAMGVPLFERTSRTVRLTPAGRVFLPEARRILRLSESAVTWTRRIWRGEGGTVRLGFTAASGYGVMPDLLTRLHAALPDIDVVLQERVTADQVDDLMHGVLDFGLIRPPVDRNRFAGVRFATERLMAALPIDDPLLGKEELELTDLEGRTLVDYAPQDSHYYHHLLRRMLAEAGVTMRTEHQVAQIHTMLALVGAGFGVALVPAVASQVRFPRIDFRPVRTDPIEPVELSLVWRRENDNPALRKALEVLVGNPDLMQSMD